VSGLREISAPFVSAAPAGVRVRTRLRVSAGDVEVLTAAGRHLGSLAGRDLAARCAEGRLDARGRAMSRAVRKRALTAESSSRWAGAITRASEDAWQLGYRNLDAERRSLQARVRVIGARVAVPAGKKQGRLAGYADPAERHAKTIRLKALEARLARVEQRLARGAVPVTRGGRRLMRARLNLAAAGLTGAQWRDRWDAARLFLTADGERGHLAVAVLAPDGNVTGTPFTICLELAGLPATARDGHVRAAVSRLIATAREHGALAVVTEDLDFTAARAEGREQTGNRPSRGRRGRRFRRTVAGIPTARFRDRLAQMTANAGLAVVVVDPAYTSRWGAEHWLSPLRQHHPETTGHHAAALVIGRRGQGHRARTRATGNRTAPEDAARPAQARTRNHPAAPAAPRKPATPRDTRQPQRAKTRTPHRTTAGAQVPEDRSRAPTKPAVTTARC
jgi:IS605 OrfB family transposase